MAMKKVQLAELSPEIRQFLAEVQDDRGIIVEDNGKPRYGVVSYRQANPQAQAEAWEDIKAIQRKVGQTMRREGKTEEEFDRLLQEND